MATAPTHHPFTTTLSLPTTTSSTTRATISHELHHHNRIPCPRSLSHSYATNPVIQNILRHGFRTTQAANKRYTPAEQQFWEAAEADGWTHGLTALYLGRSGVAVRLKRMKTARARGASAGAGAGQVEWRAEVQVQQAQVQQVRLQLSHWTCINGVPALASSSPASSSPASSPTPSPAPAPAPVFTPASPCSANPQILTLQLSRWRPLSQYLPISDDTETSAENR